MPPRHSDTLTDSGWVLVRIVRACTEARSHCCGTSRIGQVQHTWCWHTQHTKWTELHQANKHTTYAAPFAARFQNYKTFCVYFVLYPLVRKRKHVW